MTGLDRSGTNFDSIEAYRAQLKSQGYAVENWGQSDSVTLEQLADCGWSKIYSVFDIYHILKNDTIEGFVEYSNEGIWIYAKSYQNLEDIDYDLECLSITETQKKPGLYGYIDDIEEETKYYDMIDEDFDIGDEVVIKRGRMVPRYDPEWGIVVRKIIKEDDVMYGVCLEDNTEREVSGDELVRIDETGKLVWARSGDKVVKKYRCTAGHKKGRLVKTLASCGKFPDIKKRFKFKKLLSQKGARLRRKARRTKRMNPASKRVQQLNKGLKSGR